MMPKDEPSQWKNSRVKIIVGHRETLRVLKQNNVAELFKHIKDVEKRSNRCR
jgi:hypothetical protein